MLKAIVIDAKKIKSQERLDKIRTVQEEMHMVLNSSIFRDQVYKMQKHGEKSKYKDYTNAQIYAMLMEGAEEHKPDVDYIWNIWLAGYFSLKKVVGYMNIGKKWLHMNFRYFDTMSTCRVGSFFTHEQGHHLGFRHDFWRTALRPFSICYQLNKAYEYSYYKLRGKQISKVKVCYRPWKYLKLKKICTWKEIYE